MSVVEPGRAPANLVERVKSLLLRPTPTWETIDGEAASVGGLYRGYVLPLAAIGPVCQFLNNLLFGVGAFGITVRLSPVWLAAQLVVSYVFSLALIYVFALIIEALAPSFGGTRNRTQAFKVAAYAPTAGWVAAVFLLVPMLWLLAFIGGLYSFYLLYKGLPRLMKAPEEKALPYTVVVVLAGMVVGVVAAMIWGSASMMMRGPMMGLGPAGAARVEGKVSIPGAGELDLGKVQEQAQRAEAVAKQLQSGEAAPATDPEVLKAYLPAAVAGFARAEVEASSGGLGGLQGSSAEARYARGEAVIRLTVTDMGAMGALAGMANAFDVRETKETATGYEKMGKVGGRMTQESYDRQSRHGEYSVLVGDRFMIQAQGDGVSMDELKAAVAAVPAARLEGLAKAG